MTLETSAMPSNQIVPPVVVSVESGLESPGNTITVADRIPLDSFELAGRHVELADGLSYDIALTNTGDGILAAGTVRGEAKTECDRCLGPASFEVASEVACYYLKEEPDGEVDDEEDFGLINAEDGTVDLAEAIQSSLIMDIPFVILCSDDCKGLCPSCGANLNEGDCGCVIEADPDFERPNPFAALANFTFADGTTVADHNFDDDLEEEEDEDIADEDFEAVWEERESAREDENA